MTLFALAGADIHDGVHLHKNQALVANGTDQLRITPIAELPADAAVHRLDGGILMPGFVDLQVNGGGGVMFNDDQSVKTLQKISNAHASTGTLSFLPTLITDTIATTRRAIAAVESAIAQDLPGIIGIHLEGPHLAVARKGAHDPALIRPMADEDLQLILEAAARLPNVMTTVALESVTSAQIAILTQAGVIVSLGHTDATYEQCAAAFQSGAACVTHLFNAMSQMRNREPGLVGAALDHSAVSCGLIADGIHVHPATMRAALSGQAGPPRIFLVTDAMSTVGSDITEFKLNGRRILRSNGRLTLSDGTLAGADLDMPTAVRLMVEQAGDKLETAIARATSIPAKLLTNPKHAGSLETSSMAQIVHMSADLKTVTRMGAQF